MTAGSKSVDSTALLYKETPDQHGGRERKIKVVIKLRPERLVMAFNIGEHCQTVEPSSPAPIPIDLFL